jgi:hypothetical protein
MQNQYFFLILDTILKNQTGNFVYDGSREHIFGSWSVDKYEKLLVGSNSVQIF